MNILKKIVALLVLLFLFSALALPSAATSTIAGDEGLEVAVKMDKEQYEDGEPITATITVKNTKLQVVTIDNLEQLIPEGYKLSENSKDSIQNVELAYGQTLELSVTFEKDLPENTAAQQEDFFQKLFTGETMGIPNLLIIMILGIAFAVFMILT